MLHIFISLFLFRSFFFQFICHISFCRQEEKEKHESYFEDPHRNPSRCARALTRGRTRSDGSDVPGWDTVAPVCTGWTSRLWKGDRLSVGAPCAGLRCENVSLKPREELRWTAAARHGLWTVLCCSWSRTGDKTTDGGTDGNILTPHHELFIGLPLCHQPLPHCLLLKWLLAPPRTSNLPLSRYVKPTLAPEKRRVFPFPRLGSYS